MNESRSGGCVSSEAWLPTLAAVGGISLISLIGAIAGLRWFRRHTVILTLVALAAGSLLGDALLHLLPEASELWGGLTPEVGGLVLLGFGLFFILESALRSGHAHGELLQQDHDHPGHGHEHGHAHTPAKKAPSMEPTRARIATFGWMNLVGDGLHNFLDGIVIAAAFVVDPLVGLATTVAVALHEIPQELGDFAVLLRAGMRPAQAILFNLLSALLAVAGASLFLVAPFDPAVLERFALPIAAGGFLYIAAADLIPELHHHTGDRHVLNILLGFAAGLAAMACLLFLE